MQDPIDVIVQATATSVAIATPTLAAAATPTLVPTASTSDAQHWVSAISAAVSAGAAVFSLVVAGLAVWFTYRIFCQN
jgi:hypothetical protein